MKFTILTLVIVITIAAAIVVADDKGDYVKPAVSAADVRSMTFIIKDRLGIREQQLRPRPEVQEAVDALFAATTHDQLHRLPEQWRKDLPVSLRNELIRALVRKMDSRKDTKFKRTDDVVVLIQPYLNTEWRQKYFAAEKAGRSVGSYRHDIYIEGGRCAWALEEFMHLELFVIFGPMPNEELAASVRENTFLILEALGSPDEIDFNLMKAPQRRALAAKTRNRLLLWQMSKDGAREVQLAVARRSDVGYVDEQILLNLGKSLDAEISAAGKASWRTYFDEKTGVKPPKN